MEMSASIIYANSLSHRRYLLAVLLHSTTPTSLQFRSTVDLSAPSTFSRIIGSLELSFLLAHSVHLEPQTSLVIVLQPNESVVCAVDRHIGCSEKPIDTAELKTSENGSVIVLGDVDDGREGSCSTGR